jgi:hypothetical protein
MLFKQLVILRIPERQTGIYGIGREVDEIVIFRQGGVGICNQKDSTE